MFYSTKNKSFTIVELLIVISVLVVLMGIAMPRIQGMKDQGNKVSVTKELKTMEGAIESYYMFSTPKVYPPTSTAVGANYLTQVTPKAISNILYDPFNSSASTEYGYKKSSNGKYWVVYSTGLNGNTGSTIAISDGGHVRGLDGDDMCATNGKGCGNLIACGSYQCSFAGACQGGSICIDLIDSSHWGVHISDANWAAQDWNNVLAVDPVEAYSIIGTCPGSDCELVVSAEAICDAAVQAEDATHLSDYLLNYMCP